MADNENHPLVDLMLARMDTHPEEFHGEANRWYVTLIDIEEYALPEQAALIKAKIAAIRLDAAHHKAMDELLNGEERRRQKADIEVMRIQSNGTLGVGTQSPISQLQAYQNAAGPLQGVPSSNIWLPDTDLQPTQIKLGNETLDEGLLKKIKGALKI